MSHAASGEGGETGRLDEEPQDLSLRPEDGGPTGSLPPANEAVMAAGASHHILMPGSSQVSQN